MFPFRIIYLEILKFLVGTNDSAPPLIALEYFVKIFVMDIGHCSLNLQTDCM